MVDRTVLFCLAVASVLFVLAIVAWGDWRDRDE